jgi:hypothetical protein
MAAAMITHGAAEIVGHPAAEKALHGKLAWGCQSPVSPSTANQALTRLKSNQVQN